MIDMSELLLEDSPFVDTCELHQRKRVIGDTGRISEVTTVKAIRASLQPSGDTTLSTLRELLAADVTDLLDVFTLEELCAGNEERLPDRIVWRGQTFEVIRVNDFIWTGNYTRGVAQRVKND